MMIGFKYNKAQRHELNVVFLGPLPGVLPFMMTPHRAGFSRASGLGREKRFIFAFERTPITYLENPCKAYC
jgi:hypothetical protein